MSNIGKILTSTLWNQSGDIYVNVNGKQTKLNGEYNQYCPNISYTDQTKTLTGCCATMDAQILYYWLEQGADLNLSIKTTDCFTWDYNGKTYFCDNKSDIGAGKNAEINKILASDEKIGNADFIAALNFYCGVKNYSKYGETTWTQYYWEPYENGSSINANAFIAAGFDSYTFIAPTNGNEKTDRYFEYNKYTNVYDLTDVALSVFRENLDYGEIIRMGIHAYGGHFIYMDGYRKNHLNQYEYHLNFGWGNDNATDWYTAGEINDLDLWHVSIDGSPDIKVVVNDATNDYYGGSFLRGMERINNIVNNKTTSFTFTNNVLGNVITIHEAAAITSKVNVDFKNFCVTIASNDYAAFVSDYAMSFDMRNGAIIVNKDISTTYAINSTKDAQVCITLDNSYIYSGYNKGGIYSIQNVLDISGDYNINSFYDKFLATVKGYSVYAGNADDVIDLNNNSAVFGSLSLGGGNNVLSIENGSVFYGNYFGLEDSLEVNLSISGHANGAMIVLQNKEYEENFFDATSGVINLTITENFQTDDEYILLQCEGAEFIKDYRVNLILNGVNYSLDYENRAIDSYYLVYDESTISIVYDPPVPKVLSVSASDITATNENVIVTAVFSDNAYKKFYSLDGTNWLTYTDAGVEVSENGYIYFKAQNRIDEDSQIKGLNVSNIDKEMPTLDVTGKPEEWTNQDVVITVTVDKGLISYHNGNGWVNFPDEKPFQNITINKNGTYKFKVTDRAGNSTEETIIIDKIDKEAPTVTNIKADITEMTNTDVVITAEFSDNIKVEKQEYKINDGEWIAYTDQVVMTENGTVYFRATDPFGHEAFGEYEVKNIDKTPPTLKISGTPDSWTNKDIILTVWANDGTVEYYNGTEWIACSRLTVTENGEYTFRATDAVGNTSEETVVVDKIDKDAPVITTVKSIENITNQDIVLTASVNEEDCQLLYSFDNENWFDYTDLTITENKTVYFKAIDRAGNITTETVNIENIDKTIPDIPVAEYENTTKLKNSFIPIVLQSIESLQYSTDNENWESCENIFIAKDNGTFYFRAIDAAGNTSDSTSVTIGNIDFIADNSATEYFFVNNKYSKKNVAGKKQNGYELTFNENAFNTISKALTNAENNKIIVLDKEVTVSSTTINAGTVVSSLINKPSIIDKKNSYTYKVSTSAKGSLIVKNNKSNAVFENFAKVEVSGSLIKDINGGKTSRSQSIKQSSKNEIVTITTTEKNSVSASGSISVEKSTANIQNISNYAKVELTDKAHAVLISNNAISFSETEKLVDGVLSEQTISKKYSASGKVTLTDESSADRIYGAKTVKITDAKVTGEINFGNSYTEKYTLQNGQIKSSITYTRSGSVTAENSELGDIIGYTSIKLTDSTANSIYLSDVSKVTDGIEVKKLTGSATLLRADVGDIVNLSKVTMTDSSAANIENVNKVTISKGFNSIESYVGTNGNDTLTINKNAVLTLGVIDFANGEKDKLVNNGTLILSNAMDLSLLSLSGSGEIATTDAVWQEMHNYGIRNLGAVSEGYRTASYELADKTAKKAAKWDLKSDHIGWLSGNSSIIDTVDFIKFKTSDRGKLEISGFSSAESLILTDKKGKTVKLKYNEEENVFIASLSAKTEYTLELGIAKGDDSMTYTLAIV